MHIVWHCSLTAHVDKYESILAIVYDWCKYHCRDMKYGMLGSFIGAEDIRCQVADFEGQDSNVRVFQLSRPIEYQGIIWNTTVGLQRKSELVQISIEIGQTRIPDKPVRRDALRVRAPRFLAEILPLILPNGDLIKFNGSADPEDVIKLIDDPKRMLPLVIVSEDPWTSKPIIKPADVLKEVRGLAVLVWISKEAGWLLANSAARFGLNKVSIKSIIPYNGFIKIIKDRRRTSEIQPFETPLYSPEDIRENAFLPELVGWLAYNSTTQDHPRINLETIKELIYSQERKEAEILYYSEEERVKKLKVAHDELEWMYKSLEDEYRLKVSELEEKIEFLDAKNRALKYQLNETKESEQTAGDEENDLSGREKPALNYYRASSGRRPALDFVDELQETDHDQVLNKLGELPTIMATAKTKFYQKVRTAKGPITHGVYEFRINCKDCWVRIFFSKSESKPELLILSGYQKKQNELDENEIDSAEKKLREAVASGWS